MITSEAKVAEIDDDLEGNQKNEHCEVPPLEFGEAMIAHKACHHIRHDRNLDYRVKSGKNVLKLAHCVIIFGQLVSSLSLRRDYRCRYAVIWRLCLARVILKFDQVAHKLGK